ncbi:MAG: hybrid sensor histidine kinase/response regulator [Myxococcota bacterium]
MARVLHIEDDPHSRRLVEKLLVAGGHEVVEATGGLEGIRLAATLHPDLVLVDINVPDLDGYEVTLRLKAMPHLEAVPVVAITAEGDRQTSLAVGADGFIAKPIDARRFVATVERFLGGHRESADDTGAQRLRARSSLIVERLEAKVVELGDANARLEEMARLRREFLQNVSHELATPMTPIVGYVKLLLDGELGELTPLQRKVLRSMDRSTRRLRTVVDTLLDVSALESGRMHYYERAYDFLEVVRGALEQVREMANDDVHAFALGKELADDDESWDAVGDPDKLRRAIVHVLDNAQKFTPRDGTIAVDVQREGRRYAVRVADDGPGIAPEERARIFDSFYQVDGSATRQHGGVGLGLAFAQRVSRALGGAVSVESPPAGPVAGHAARGTLVTVAVAARGKGEAG